MSSKFNNLDLILPAQISYRLLIFFILLQTNLTVFSQNNSLSLDKWIKNLDADDDTLNKNLNEIGPGIEEYGHHLLFFRS
jgi:hypothetical protein